MRRATPIALLVTLLPAISQAQSRSPTFTLAGGLTSYDLAGTGTAPAGAIRADQRVFPFLIFELSLEYMAYDAQGGTRNRLLMPEFSVQATTGLGRVHPFIGGGVGFGILVTGPGEDVATLHAVGGMRIVLAPAWGARGEVRIRSLDPFTGTMGDFTLGLSWSP
jgi:hypothetical protein